jgi:hypothetical protein
MIGRVSVLRFEGEEKEVGIIAGMLNLINYFG